MAWPELLSVAGVTLAISAGIGVAAVALLLLLRRTRLFVQLVVVVLAGVAAVVTSMIAASNLMYLSSHDLTVAINVAVVSGIGSLLLAATLSAWVARNARTLAEAAQRIGEGRSPSAPVGGMSSELQRLADQLAEADARLQEARERESRIESSRRELVAWISHDLRTPLAGIRAMAEALEDGMIDDPERYHRQMRTQVDQLSGMVDDLFQLSKIDSGTLQLSLDEVSLLDVVSDTVAELRPATRGRTVLVESALARDLVVLVDPRELSRAIGNLVMNAVQHTPASAPVIVRTELVDGRPAVSVIDSGGGIAAADIERVFEPGWRGSTARTPREVDRSPGAGLGLAIVRGIITAHQGEVTVRNEHGGVRFDLLLPATAALSA